VVTLARALVPSAVLNEPPTLPGSGVSWACISWQSAKHTITSGIRNEPRNYGAWFVGFLKFALNDVIFSRIFFFIIRGFSRACGFLGIRRIAYESYCRLLCRLLRFLANSRCAAGFLRDPGAFFGHCRASPLRVGYLPQYDFLIVRAGRELGRLKVGEWVSLKLKISRSVDLWQDSTCQKRSANRKNSRIGKSAISRKQPMLFSSKQWESSSLRRATRRSVILAQVGVDNVILVRPSLGL
jgi:hypothetical protein